MVDAPIFAFERVSKTYGSDQSAIVALDEINLHVEPGQFVAICGQSGSGKSTLLALLGGLCRPSAGSIMAAGSDLGRLTPNALADFRGRHVGFVFQFASLLPNLRAVDNVALPALLQGDGSYEQAYAAARQRLIEVGLGDRSSAYPRELSGGQQRRVAIARALVNKPPLLLADEPTSDLDEQSEQEIFALLRAVQQAHRSTLVLVTHNIELARAADRLIYLDRGRIVQDFVPEARPRDQRTLVEAAAWSPPRHTALAVPTEPIGSEPVPLGAGLGRFMIDFVGWTLAVALLIFVVNYSTARLQRSKISQMQDSRRQLEELALRSLRANLDDLVERPDGSYLLTLALDNVAEDRPVYFMGPTLRAFVQIDRSWQAIPLKPVEPTDGQVERLDGRRVLGFSFRVDQDRFDELLQGYLHLRITNSMLIAESATPGEDLFERTDDIYVYLRPRSISEAQVRERNGWKADSIVPLWIPMPAH